MDIHILKELRIIKGKYDRKYIIAQTIYGLIKYDHINYKKGHKITYNLAINKKQFLETYFRQKYNKNIRILNIYENRILLLYDNIKYDMLLKNLFRSLPNSRSCIENTKNILNKLNKIHNNKYLYSNFKYKKLYQNIDIICPIHGTVTQLLKRHLKGIGCKICNYSILNTNQMTYTKGIKNAIVYCIKMKEKSGLEFYKIGFTRHSVKYRFTICNTKSKLRMPYEYEIIFEESYPYKEAIIKEKEYHFVLAKEHYKPLNKFDGSATECFLNIKKLNYENYLL